MRCPACSAEIPDGSKFCQQCGTLLNHDQSAPSVPVEVIPPTGQADAGFAGSSSTSQEPNGGTGWQSASGQSYDGGSSGQPCGSPFGQSQGSSSGQTPYPSTSNLDMKAVASLICGVVGFFFLTVILGTIAVVLGNEVRKLTDPLSSTHKIATIGWVVGIVDLAFCVFTVLLSCSVGALSGFLSVL